MGTICGLFAALSLMLSDAEALPLPPLAVGVNVTLMVQLAAGASEAPQLLVCENSLASCPASAIEVMFSCAVPLLVSVTGLVALVPTVCGWLEEPKMTGVGLSIAAGAGTVRLIVVVCIKLPESPVTVTVAMPVAAVALAVKVRVLLLVAGLGLNAAVTPLGKPDAESVTFPLKPFIGVMVIVLVP